MLGVVTALFMAAPAQQDGCKRSVRANQFSDWASKVWRLPRWERGAPKRRTIQAQRKKLRCAAGPGHRKAMRKSWRKSKRAYYRHRGKMKYYHALTPYDCGSAGRFAVPCYIVACESGYSWSAYNPSGALGPYQLLGWGAPFPVGGWRDKMEHHRIAGELWSGGSGASHWVCA